jgi:hypothetical protein
MDGLLTILKDVYKGSVDKKRFLTTQNPSVRHEGCNIIDFYNGS